MPLKLSRLLHGYNAVAHVPTATYTIAHMCVILMRDIVNLTLHIDNSTCISKVVDIINLVPRPPPRLNLAAVEISHPDLISQPWR